jgi:hypothetical protein
VVFPPVSSVWSGAPKDTFSKGSVFIMSEEEKVTQVASLHATLTALAVSVGRLEEQMKAVRDDLRHHQSNDHHHINNALKAVEDIKKEVGHLQQLVDNSKGAWWVLVKIAGAGVAIGGVVAWLFDHASHLTPK